MQQTRTDSICEENSGSRRRTATAGVFLKDRFNRNKKTPKKPSHLLLVISLYADDQYNEGEWNFVCAAQRVTQHTNTNNDSDLSDIPQTSLSILLTGTGSDK